MNLICKIFGHKTVNSSFKIKQTGGGVQIASINSDNNQIFINGKELKMKENNDIRCLRCGQKLN